MDLTLAAQADLASLLVYSAETFGESARRRYQMLVRIGMEDLARDPACAGSLMRSELGAGVRTYHLRHCRSRASVEGRVVADPRHLLAYLADEERVLILRVLHDAMDLRQHVPDTSK